MFIIMEENIIIETNTQQLGEYINYIAKAINEKGEEIGEFRISGKGFDTGQTMDMGIHVLDGYKGRGLSRTLIKELCIHIKNEYPQIRPDQFLFIDTDASWEYNAKKDEYVSFWDYIGMDENRYYDSNRDIEGQGYEKNITFQDLCKWCGANIYINFTSGKKSQKKVRKVKKSQKKNKKKKKNLRKYL